MALIGTTGGQWPPVVQVQGGPVKKYKTTINGVETTLLLNDADAKAAGLLKGDTTKAKTPANKAASPQKNKAGG